MQTTTRRSYFRNIWLITSFLYASLIAAWGSTYYVSPTGDDINGTGTSTSPFQTIQRAADLVNPGDTVIVKDGVYTTSNWGLVVLTRGGNSSAWVSFKSENKGGAVLDGQNYTTTYGFDIEPPGASYVQIQDFEVRNFKKIAINLNWPGGNYDISGNHIHHIGRICSDEEVGYGGMYIHNVTNVVVEKNVIHDIGRFGFLENGCIPLTTYYQNHDHGVYVDGVTGITIKNNTFYNIGHGWGIHFYSGNGVRSSSILVANNTFAFPNPDRDGQIILAAPGVSDANIQNNIFYSPRTAGVRISPDSTTFTNVLISYNLVRGGTITSGSASGITVSNNMDNTDPLLVNPSLHDFHLQAGSPAINTGASLIQVSDDMDGNSRPQAAYWDIGADEYIPGAITYYVSPTGNDNSPGTNSAAPFQTIQRAADLVNPGDTVIVKDGLYTRNNWGLVIITRGGNSAGWVSFKSEHKGGAVLDGQNNTTSYGFHLEPPGASYLQIQDFELRNFKKTAIDINWPPGSNYDISGNHIHHIGRICSDEEVGYGGIYLHNVTNVVVQRNTIHDIGRFSPNENGCVPLTTYYQNLDHGVYVDGVTAITLKNNIFYNLGHGWGIHFYSGDGVRSSSILVANNTFAFPNPYREGQIILASPGVDDANIQNNIFYSPTTAGVRISPTSTTFTNVLISYNLVYGGVINSGSASGITTTNNIENTDPRLVNPGLYDFHLQSTSPAIDAGAGIAQVTEDIDGNSRPQGPAWDIGVDEYTP